MTERDEQGLATPMVSLYDVFVDWPGRLSREIPGLVGLLRDAGATRVLDVGCGTGRHVGALRKQGFDAHGADVSADMLAKAAAHLGSEDGLHAWRLGDPVSASLEAVAPFDAIVCVGNVWPSLTDPGQSEAALSSLHALLRPGGLLVIALKALDVRREANAPYLPLLKREFEGRPIWFLRFADLASIEASDGVETCEFHMAVVRGGADDETTADLHSSRRWRVWSPDSIRAAVEAAGFSVRLAGTLADPVAAPTYDDVVVIARVAS